MHLLHEFRFKDIEEQQRINLGLVFMHALDFSSVFMEWEIVYQYCHPFFKASPFLRRLKDLEHKGFECLAAIFSKSKSEFKIPS